MLWRLGAEGGIPCPHCPNGCSQPCQNSSTGVSLGGRNFGAAALRGGSRRDTIRLVAACGGGVRVRKDLSAPSATAHDEPRWPAAGTPMARSAVPAQAKLKVLRTTDEGRARGGTGGTGAAVGCEDKRARQSPVSTSSASASVHVVHRPLTRLNSLRFALPCTVARHGQHQVRPKALGRLPAELPCHLRGRRRGSRCWPQDRQTRKVGIHEPTMR